MNAAVFARIAESLRQYRRAELKDFQAELGGDVMDKVYVDPLHGDAVLATVLSTNTTFLVGRKGTGKSTVFAKAQSDIRKRTDLISAYIDVKTIYELVNASAAPAHATGDADISDEVLRIHLLRKAFLGTVIAEVIKELREAARNLSLWDRWRGKKRDYQDVGQRLTSLADRVRVARLDEQELPILRLITKKTKDREEKKKAQKGASKGTVTVGLQTLTASSDSGFEEFEETILDGETYREYADAVLRSFPFAEIIDEIKDLLNEAGMTRLVALFDDFSELAWPDQKLFVDVILAPLNNASEERIKLKIAGYPGRIYYGKIDPGKVDTIQLDFFDLYKSADIQTAEASAIDYTQRLLEARFAAFGEATKDYFDPAVPLTDHMRQLFECTLNVPRLIGYVLHHCYLDRVSKEQVITSQAIRLASEKYYETVIAQYFDRANRFALEPFEQKLDRHNQKALLDRLISEARDVRRRISTGDIGGTYFAGLSSPPVSHFAISPDLERMLSSLEMNFLVTKYHEMRDKDGADVSIFALCYGLCESERLAWGYPRGRREDRSYFVQRCFNYNGIVKGFLADTRTIRCEDCGACFPVEKRESFELFKWGCPTCKEGTCRVVRLSDDFSAEMQSLDRAMMLPAVELDILETLHQEGRAMKASEISVLIDATYQLVGKRTGKLQQMGLVKKADVEGATKSSIATKAQSLYFSQPDLPAFHLSPAEPPRVEEPKLRAEEKDDRRERDVHAEGA